MLVELAREIHKTSKKNGFWEDYGLTVFNAKSTRLMLMVSEIAEAQEALRRGNPPDDKIPEFNGETAELADVIIRILDYCEFYELPIVEAVLAKVAFNATRPYKHGKSF